jgi:DNA integrity scanning protein DisA with diadenylate cyclase activity
MIVQIAQATSADFIICGTETGSLFRHVQKLAGSDMQLVAATPNPDTQATLEGEGFDALRLSIRVAHKYKQARHAISMAVNMSKVPPGQLVVCAVGHNLCHGGADIVILTDVESGGAEVDLYELIKLTNGIRPNVLEAVLHVACKIGRASRRGKRIGALFVVGDSDRVLEGSKALILNPFEGHANEHRTVLNENVHAMLVELAKLDGAFVVRGDGFIRAGGAFLASATPSIELPKGLGARHASAAAVTEHTSATSVVVSATDGYVRAFSGGQLVLEMDPDIPIGPVAADSG